MEQNNKSAQIKLSSLRIAFLYFGVLMGAGFASGKELWQFFGVFGIKGIPGIAIIAAVFITLGFIIVYISKSLNTADLSKIIFPYEQKIIENIIGFIVASFLFIGYFSMLAAGGALVHEQLGIHKTIGSMLLMLLVVLTTVKGFGIVSSRIGKVTPVLLLATLLMSIFIIITEFENIKTEQIIQASPLAPNWLIAAIVFVSYNITGAIPILGSCAIYSEKEETAKRGAILGGIFLGTCALILFLVTLTDPVSSENYPLPMLYFSKNISSVVQKIYSVILLISVFGTATSCFYGACTKLPDSNKKKYIIWIGAIAGFGASLFGFSNIVALIYPLEGYLGFIFILLMIWNFYRIKKGNRVNNGR